MPSAKPAPLKTTVGSTASKAKVSVGGASTATGSNNETTKALQAEVSDMKLNMDTLEKERDFYFGKLRDIEMLLQANQSQSSSLTENVLKILYASEEEKVLIEEDGSLIITNKDGHATNADNDDDLLDDEEAKLN